MKRIWTTEEMEYLKNVYPTMTPIEEIINHLGRAKSGVYAMGRKLGLNRPKDIDINIGKALAHNPSSIQHRFAKGHIPMNKGTKMSLDVYKKVCKTMFTKGHIPVNHRSIGSERVNVDGYIEVKVAEPNKWRLKHRVVWEEENGKIPYGSNIQFKNHNTQDCRLENLYIITKADQMKNENSMYAKYPKEMQEVIRMKGCINRQIHKYQKTKKTTNE